MPGIVEELVSESGLFEGRGGEGVACVCCDKWAAAGIVLDTDLEGVGAFSGKEVKGEGWKERNWKRRCTDSF